MEIDSAKLRQLIQAHLDQRLTDEEFEELEQYLSENPDAREEYVELARLDAGLRDAVPASADIVRISEPVVGVSMKWIWGVAAAVLVLAALLIFPNKENAVEAPDLAVDVGKSATALYKALDRIRKQLQVCIEARLSAG